MRASPTAGLLRSARPKQWTKNVLVAAAPAAAGVLGHGDVLWRTAVAFVAFCIVSSGAYLLNDAADTEEDRLHPTKRLRPIAAGVVPVGLARTVGVTCLVVGIAIAFAVTWELGTLVAGYVVLTAAYSWRLKRVPVFDIAIVASGFFLRAVAGGLATDLPISRWFVIVIAFGSLYIVTGKRYAELKALGPGAPVTRSTLAHYSREYLAHILAISGGITILALCLWAFEGRPGHDPSTWTALAVVPVILGLMRYGLLIDQGHGEEPEELVLGDRQLQVFGLAFVILFGLGIYH